MLESIIESSTKDEKSKQSSKIMNRSTSNPKILKESLLTHTMRNANNYCSKDYSITNLSVDRNQEKSSPT